MEIVEKNIVLGSKDLEWREVKIMPIGDLQLGTGGVAVKRFKEDIQRAIDENMYLIGMGDIVDVMSPSNRQKFVSAEFYDSVQDVLVEHAESVIQEFLDMVRGTEGRWLGFLEGHHTFHFPDGTRSDQRIAQALDAPFLKSTALIRLRFMSRGKAGARRTVTIFCTHGKGSGIRPHSPLNTLYNLIPYFDADIYVMGHQHKKAFASLSQIGMSRSRPYRLIHRQKVLACTGGYLLGYEQGKEHYPERRLLNPTDLGSLVITIQPFRHNSEDEIRIQVQG